MRINSVPDVKCFCNNKNVLRAPTINGMTFRAPPCTLRRKQLIQRYVSGMGSAPVTCLISLQFALKASLKTGVNPVPTTWRYTNFIINFNTRNDEKIPQS